MFWSKSSYNSIYCFERLTNSQEFMFRLNYKKETVFASVMRDLQRHLIRLFSNIFDSIDIIEYTVREKIWMVYEPSFYLSFSKMKVFIKYKMLVFFRKVFYYTHITYMVGIFVHYKNDLPEQVNLIIVKD